MFRHDFGVIFWVHLAVILTVVLSPFLFSVWIFMVGLLIFWLQLMLFGGCVLARLQFSNRPNVQGFYHYYLNKLGIEVGSTTINRFVDRTQPVIIIVLGIIWQWLFGFHPLII